MFFGTGEESWSLIKKTCQGILELSWMETEDGQKHKESQ